MNRLAIVAALSLAFGWQSPAPQPQEKLPDFSGMWKLNARLSDNPAEANFEAPHQTQNRGGGFSGGLGGFGIGRGGGRGGGGSRGHSSESEGGTPTAEEKANLTALTDELKKASATLTIAHKDPSLTITDALGHVMFFQTTASRDPHALSGATFYSTSHWESDHIVVEYAISGRRTLVCAYGLIPATNQLVVRIHPQFNDSPASSNIELKLVYEKNAA
jgi:hypothetical protein